MIALPIDTAGALPMPPGAAVGFDPQPGLEPALAHALADELVGITGLLGDLAYELAGNPETLRHHMHGLQVIDRITQAQLAVADMLRSSAPVDQRVAAVTLEDLGASIREAVNRYRRDGIPDDLGDLDHDAA